MNALSKKDLLVEEAIIVLCGCLLFAGASLGASAVLPTKVNLVNCGSRVELDARCEQDSRCCALLERYKSQMKHDRHDEDTIESYPYSLHQAPSTAETFFE